MISIMGTFFKGKEWIMLVRSVPTRTAHFLTQIIIRNPHFPQPYREIRGRIKNQFTSQMSKVQQLTTGNLSECNRNMC